MEASHASSTAQKKAAAAAAEARLRAVLLPLKLSALSKRALASGVGQGQVDAAKDGESPKSALIALVVEASLSSAVSEEAESGRAAAAAALRAQLQALPPSELEKRARATAGVAEAAVDAAIDDDDGEPHRALVQLLCV
eukprot:COSAG01_NODE_96_length_26789_cov_36.697089_28_plen_139_part_00